MAREGEGDKGWDRVRRIIETQGRGRALMIALTHAILSAAALFIISSFASFFSSDAARSVSLLGSSQGSYRCNPVAPRPARHCTLT